MPRSPGGNPPPRGGEDLEYWLTALHLGASGATGADQVVHQVAKLVRVFTPPGVPRFVAYFRVSTEKQGVSGLGLDAQRDAVSRHVAIAQGVIVAEFQDLGDDLVEEQAPPALWHDKGAVDLALGGEVALEQRRLQCGCGGQVLAAGEDAEAAAEAAHALAIGPMRLLAGGR